MLLLVERKDVSMTTGDVRNVVDDVLLRPVERIELIARIESLLRARRLSLRLRRMSDAYEQERAVAQRLQEAALPQTLPTIPGMQFHAFYRAGMDEARVGGDWYDALRLADGRVVITVGDVDRRGLLRVGRSSAADAPSRRSWQELTAPGLPLGVLSRVFRVTETSAMPKDSLLILYTDGLIEATRDLETGESRLRAALNDAAIVGAENVAYAIYDSVIVNEASDDIAIFALRRECDPNNDQIEHWSFNSGSSEEARATRRAYSERLIEQGLAAGALHAAEVVFSELLGNVVRYAPGETEVALDQNGSAPVLHVLDVGRGFRHLPKLPDDVLSERGRGLYIVSALCDDFTVTRRSRGGSHARAVLSLAEPTISPFDTIVSFGDLDTMLA